MAQITLTFSNPINNSLQPKPLLGVAATATATVSGSAPNQVVNSVTINTAGGYYSSVPTVTESVKTGNATYTAVLTNGVLTSIVVAGVNNNYSGVPTLTINGPELFGHDIIYFVKSSETQVRELGKCIAISSDRKTITVQVVGIIPTPGNQAYVFFGKDTETGTSGLDGYYAKVQMKNTTTTGAELFAVSSDIVQSSK